MLELALSLLKHFTCFPLLAWNLLPVVIDFLTYLLSSLYVCEPASGLVFAIHTISAVLDLLCFWVTASCISC
jgi:hypothetical protein